MRTSLSGRTIITHKYHLHASRYRSAESAGIRARTWNEWPGRLQNEGETSKKENRIVENGSSSFLKKTPTLLAYLREGDALP